MGRIKTKDIKTIGRELVEKFPDKFNINFEYNKRVLDDLKLFESKKMRNKVAGYIVRLMKQLERENQNN